MPEEIKLTCRSKGPIMYPLLISKDPDMKKWFWIKRGLLLNLRSCKPVKN